MIKKIILNTLIVLSITSINAFAITITNDNGHTVKYTINDSVTCGAAEYTKGEISSGGQINWTKTLIIHPDKVCVHVTGFTSTIGEYAYGVNNDNCILRVYDAGFLRGIKIEKVSGC
jgi:hypothetical protein